MIRIVRASDTPTPEAEVAQQIHDGLLQVYPEAALSREFQIDLIPNAFCPRQTYSEIDVLLVCEFPTGLIWRPLDEFLDTSGRPISEDEILLRSFVLTVEVKDHSADSVRFDGNKISVRYVANNEPRWHDATAQSTGQAKCLASYLRSIGLQPPWVSHLLYLRNVLPHEFPRLCEGVLGANFSWSNLLQAALQTNPPRWSSVHQMFIVDAFGLDSPDGPYINRPADMVPVFTSVVRPSELDRHRMERLGEASSKTAIEQSKLSEHLGEKMILLRGAGGTGKTVLLLQIARYLHDTQDARILLLTYNHALVGELFRLLVLLRIDRQIRFGSIVVRTVHGYLGEMCDTLVGDETVENGEPTESDQSTYGERYAAKKQAALRVLQNAAPASGSSESFDPGYDYALVDEGQDWPTDERDLLVALFSHKNLIVAEGMGQFVRSSTQANWRGSLKKSDVYVHGCDTCLRQKTNVSRFVQQFADALQIRSFGLLPGPNFHAPGGRVIVVDGDYFADEALHTQLNRASTEAKNTPIDFLYCVPPSLVSSDSDANRYSLPGMLLTEWGASVWDGVDAKVRQTIPCDNNAFRVITYDSCRGLEGWTCVLLALDDFYNHKMRVFDADEGGAADTPEEMAGLWSLVAMLRAMDTLVITLSSSSPSPVRDALEAVYPACRDFMEWHTPPNE